LHLFNGLGPFSVPLSWAISGQKLSKTYLCVC